MQTLLSVRNLIIKTQKVTKQMSFGDDVTNLNLYGKGNAYNEYFVKTEEEENGMSETGID